MAIVNKETGILDINYIAGDSDKNNKGVSIN
jgi:hypothetical protein